MIAQTAGSMRAERARAELEACDFHPGPTAASPAAHARQIQDACAERNAGRLPPTWFLGGRRDRDVFRQSERLAGRQESPGGAP